MSLPPCLSVQFLLMTTKSVRTASTSRNTSSRKANPITMSIDIGGSGLKAMLLDGAGKPVSERVRVITPAIPTPRAVLKGLDELHTALSNCDRVSVGFPGVIKKGVTCTAANLHPSWYNFPLEAELLKRLKKPVRLANDAAVQGYGAIKGHGKEHANTHDTDLGSSL